MSNINRIYATLLLIRYAVFPAKRAARFYWPSAGGGITRTPPQAFAAQLSTLETALQANGKLEILFEDALAPAAPFLLYYLKRNGFSECRAVVEPDGIIVTARR